MRPLASHCGWNERVHWVQTELSYWRILRV